MSIFEITIFGFNIAPSYYGLMYVIGFIIWYQIIKIRLFSKKSVPFVTKNNKKFIEKESRLKIHKSASEYMDSLLFYIFLWVILGWRIGYILFYNFNQYLDSPLDILKVWEWGMSFHWWLLWVTIALYLFSKKNKISLFALSDEIAAVVPVWLLFWRIWNYLNKELLGYSDYFWPLAVKVWNISYFPSPLLEALLEWLILFLLLNYIYLRKKFHWQIAALFLIFYWVFRILIEVFFRTPDSHIGYILPYISLGTLYSLPMCIAGIILYYYAKKHESIT